MLQTNFTLAKTCTHTSVKSALILLLLMGAASAAEIFIIKFIGSGSYDSRTAILIISSEEMEYIKVIIKSLENLNLWIKKCW